MVQQKPTTVLEVFRDSILEIPEYQRDFSWKAKHVEDLLRDIDYMLHEEERDGNNFHYFGTIVLHKRDEIPVGGDTYTKYDIVDGQQRLTTISLIIGAIIEKMNDLSVDPDNLQEAELRPDAQTGDLQEDYIEKRGKRRLYLHGRDQETFNSLVYNQQDPGMIGGETASQRNLIEAKKKINAWLNDFDVGSDIDYYRKLLDVVRIVNNNFEATEYKVDSISEAGRIFETLNDRGRVLSTIDKIKSYLVYAAYRIDEEALAERIYEDFGVVIDNVTRHGSESELDQFVEEHWRMFSGEAKFSRGGDEEITDLHRRIKSVEDHIPLDRDRNEIIDWIDAYLSSLKESSRAHRLMMHPAQIDTSQFDGPVEDTIRNLKNLHRHAGNNNVNALLMALYSKYGFSKELVLATDLLERFAWRVFQVCRANSNVRRTKFRRISFNLYYAGEPEQPASIFKARSEADVDVYPNPAKGLESVLYEIENAIGNYASGAAFVTNLRRHDVYDGDLNEDGWNGFRNKSKVRYFLHEYERNLRMKHGSLPQTPSLEEWEESNVQIEHIWPDSGNTVPDGLESEHKEYKDCLGNLALLHPDDNKTLSDKPYDKKHKEVYSDSPMHMLSELQEPEASGWDVDAIKDRLGELIEFAAERWAIETKAEVAIEIGETDTESSDQIKSTLANQIRDEFDSSYDDIPGELNNLPKVEFVKQIETPSRGYTEYCTECQETSMRVSESGGSISLKCDCGENLDKPLFVVNVNDYDSGLVGES
jgi:hypothetical protein